jgi:hypothetical protein
MITGTDLLHISLVRINLDRSDLERAGVIDSGKDGDRAWTNFGRDMDTFISKLTPARRDAMARIISRRATAMTAVRTPSSADCASAQD